MLTKPVLCYSDTDTLYWPPVPNVPKLEVLCTWGTERLEMLPDMSLGVRFPLNKWVFCVIGRQEDGALVVGYGYARRNLFGKRRVEGECVCRVESRVFLGLVIRLIGIFCNQSKHFGNKSKFLAINQSFGQSINRILRQRFKMVCN